MPVLASALRKQLENVIIQARDLTEAAARSACRGGRLMLPSRSLTSPPRTASCEIDSVLVVDRRVMSAGPTVSRTSTS